MAAVSATKLVVAVSAATEKEAAPLSMTKSGQPKRKGMTMFRGFQFVDDHFQSTAHYCLRLNWLFNAVELDFIRDMVAMCESDRTPTDKQRAWLDKLYRRALVPQMKRPAL